MQKKLSPNIKKSLLFLKYVLLANKINIKLTSHIKGIEIVKILSDTSPLPKKAFTDKYDIVVRKVDKIKKIFI